MELQQDACICLSKAAFDKSTDPNGGHGLSGGRGYPSGSGLSYKGEDVACFGEVSSAGR